MDRSASRPAAAAGQNPAQFAWRPDIPFPSMQAHDRDQAPGHIPQNMKPETVRSITKELPYMRLAQGRAIHEFIVAHGLHTCLELGFYHGVSSLYIAGALEEVGGGRLYTIDREKARGLAPNILDLVARANLGAHVTPFFEPISFTWRLMKFLEEGRQASFDFCYLDGGHWWDTTGFAFFLVSRLLRPGGWIIFDDLNWTLDGSRNSRLLAAAPSKSEEERATQQVRKVFELLVKTDRDFPVTYEKEGWGYAQKRA